jgi:hypothetical protein
MPKIFTNEVTGLLSRLIHAIRISAAMIDANTPSDGDVAARRNIRTRTSALSNRASHPKSEWWSISLVKLSTSVNATVVAKPRFRGRSIACAAFETGSVRFEVAIQPTMPAKNNGDAGQVRVLKSPKTTRIRALDMKKKAGERLVIEISFEVLPDHADRHDPQMLLV